MKLGEVIQLNKDALIDIKDATKYCILGVKSYGKGVVIKQKVFGKDLHMKKYKVARKNQLMWCKVDTKNGAFGITKEEHIGCIASTNMALADINIKKIFPEFLELLFRNKFFYELINSKSTGTTNRKYLKPSEVCTEIDIPNFSLKEQELFLKKYTLFKSSKIHKNIVSNLLLIQKLRQAILKEAVSGKLIPQYPNDEPASEILKKIEAEKEQLIKEKKIKKDKTPPITEEEIPYELPKGWAWCRLGEISQKISDGVHYAPTYLEKGVHCISAKDVYSHKINLKNSNYVSNKEYCSQKNKFNLRKNSLLVTKSGSIGRTAIFDGSYDLYLVESIGVINFNNYLINPRYIQYLLDKIFDSITYSGDFVRGLAVKHLTLKLIGSIPVPLPPLNEQKQIVKKVDNLIKYCDEIKEKVKENQKNSELLMEAILRESFTAN
jgi:type I restriction enzyme, S subunit